MCVGIVDIAIVK